MWTNLEDIMIGQITNQQKQCYYVPHSQGVGRVKTMKIEYRAGISEVEEGGEIVQWG